MHSCLHAVFALHSVKSASPSSNVSGFETQEPTSTLHKTILTLCILAGNISSKFGKSPFVFGPTTGSTVTSNGPNTPNGILSGSSGDANGGCISAYPGHPSAYQHGPSGPEQWLPQHLQHQQIHMHPGTGLVVGCESGNMRGGASPARDSPGHSNRNSAASSDSGRGYSTGGGHGGLDSKLSHNYVNVHVSSNNVSGHTHHLHQQKHVSNNGGGLHASSQQQQQQQQQHRLSGQSYESGVSSRQSYHSSGSSSVGSLDLLEEQGYSTSATINVGQLVQAGVADTEVLHAWLHDLDFGEYYPLFLQAGYDMPTISRMTPEDLTAIGITKPAHRKRLKSEIARLNIHDGIPDFRPSDLMEWLHLLGLGAYLDTLCGQGYDSLDYVTDITWEDLEEIGIKKLGHQKKIMLAIDRLKRLKSSGKRMSSTDGRTASLELLEPPPPAPPISGRWSGGEGILPPNMYDASGYIIGGVRPKKSPSGDSISTTSSGNSGSGSSGAGSGSHHYPHGGEMRVIPLPREDAGGAGLAGAMPYRHNSTGSASGLQPDVVAIQVKRNLRSSTSEDKRGPVTSHGGFFPPQQQQQYNHPQQLMYHSFQGPVRRTSESDVFADHHSQIRSFEAEDRRRPSAQAEFDSEKHEAELRTEGKKSFFPSLKPGLGDSNNQASLSIEAGEHIYDTPQISPSQNSGKPAVMPKPTVSFASSSGLAGSLHVSTTADVSQPQSKSSPSGKSGKKVPPPPPVRTDSIRQENAPPGSPNRCLSTGQPLAPSVSVSATIHPPSSSSSSTTSTPMPAPVPPKVAAKPAPPPVMQKPQLHQATVVAKMQQQTSSAQHQHHNPHINSSVSPGQYPSQPIQPGPNTPGMQQQFRPEPSIIIKPKSCSGPPPAHGHQQSLIKSPLPSKAPIGSSSASTSNSHNQSMLSSSYQQPKNQGMSQTVSTTSSVVSSAKGSDPQAQALSNCMKSLSEKLGVKNLQREEKEKDDEDQFPDNVSTDSDDFPPPPPPIAMDIITPKIHNYGIPSSRKQGEYGLHHRHDFSHKPQPSLMGSPRLIVGPGGSVVGSPRVGGGMNTTVSYAEVHHRADAATSRTAPLKASGVGPGFRGPNSGHVIGQQALLNRQPQAQPSVLGSVSVAATPSGSPHPSQMPPAVPIKTSTHSQVKESTPEPAHPMSNENRSDSTSSFESSSSSSSLDSNTLPFANENVGTIKQRAAAVTTGADTASATVPAPENPSVYSMESARSKDYSISQDNESHRTVPGGIPSSSSSKPSSVHPLSSCSSGHQSFPHQQRQQLTSSQPPCGVRPPVPTKKPTLSPKPVRPKEESTTATAASDQGHVAQKQLWAQEERPAQELNSNNVLSDIDDMLQGLTDELDAALEEELGS
ncbi:caskin-1 [Plakobranchus ocellatus]|uniref:Caskin-1 n=1 Tax=Plakobranchus ocellatus TaxID=259542 RepID=A0AAV3YYD9_9GAST|nr:caskin-1 [Plakobranchus ocellatus]